MTGPGLSLEVHEQAARQIEDVRDWWRRNRQGSPEALRDELARVFELITLQPGVGTPVRRHPSVRRVLLPRVGYSLYYRLVPDAQSIVVLAFWHVRRGTGPRL